MLEYKISPLLSAEKNTIGWKVVRKGWYHNKINIAREIFFFFFEVSESLIIFKIIFINNNDFFK